MACPNGPQDDMRIDYPGLLREPLPSGNVRWRVRHEKDKTKRTLLNVTPDHPLFLEYYDAARAGISLAKPEADKPSAVKGSVGWLVELYTEAMNTMNRQGQMASATVKQRKVFLDWFREQRGTFRAATMPPSDLVKLHDLKADTPGAADYFVKAVRAMYAWAILRGLAQSNPGKGIGKLNIEGTGATAWTFEDLRADRDRHPPGTMAHLALTLFMFTACRISDAVRLGRANEITRQGVTWLDFQPGKRGSKRVGIPLLPPLQNALRSGTVVGKTYLLTEQGKPFQSSNAFDNKFRSWVAQAGLVDAEGKATRSSHGIRKAAGELLALEGASQYQIMAVHGHASPKTSQVYTDGVDRDALAARAMAKLARMDW